MTATSTAKGSKPYDNVKKAVEFYLPGSGAMYFGLSQIWGLPAGAKVVGTISVLTVFLGGWLKISRAQYYGNENNFEGNMVVTETPDGETKLHLEVPDDPSIYANKKSVEFKVKVPH